MRDSSLIKFCLILFILSLIALTMFTTSLEQPETAIIKKINSNKNYLNITVQTNNHELTIAGFQKAPIPIKEGDYIEFTGTLKNGYLEPKKISKIKIIA